MPAETAKSFIERTKPMYAGLPQEVCQLVYTDAGLVSMQLMLVARAKGYDTVPMGYYDKAKLVEAFGVPAQHASIMLIALGKAAKPDHPTTRLPIEDVVFFNQI